MKKVLKIGLVFFCIVCNIHAAAQNESADIGFIAGGTIPITDYSSIKVLQSVKPCFGAFYRYNFNTRYSLRFSALYSNVGAKGYLNNPSEELSFQKPYIDLGASFEVNYLDYLLGNNTMKFSPYLFYGAGFSFFEQNEGILLVTGNVHFGTGVKYSINKRIGIGFEASARKLFNDELDNLDNPYSQINLDDVNDFLHNNDWVNYFGLTLTYKFFRGRKPCPAY